MIGTKFYKNDYDANAYAEAAEWCNATQQGMIDDKGDYYEVVAVPTPTQKEKNEAEIARLKAELAATDYKCMKFVDGALTEKEYAEVRAYRSELRAKINVLEK